ncbi:patatin [Candidatus Acetothermia bacterium]|nr:MAG: patatin [Candidatus Acetothermia bacterium]
MNRRGAHSRPKIGFALASGGARGAAITGAMKVLDREGIEVSAIAGSSIGALVGAAHAAEIPIEKVEEEWLATDLPKLFRGFLPTFPRAGLSSGSELRKMLVRLLGDIRIEELPIPFAAVACDIDTGEEVVLREGPLVDAVRASTAIPGLFHPVRWGDRLLVDGGLVDPLPVGVCRDLGAEFVIALDITQRPQPTTKSVRSVWSRIGERLKDMADQTWVPNTLSELLDGVTREQPERSRPLPGLYSILNQSIAIMIQEIVRQKLASSPPDLLIRPDVSLSFLGYLHAADGIRAGERAAEEALPELRRLLSRYDRNG